MLLIFGCGGHARSVADVALANGIKEIIFVDDKARPNEKMFDFDVVKTIPTLDDVVCHVAVGDNHHRAKIFEELLKNKLFLASIISNDAHLGFNAEVKAGVFVGRGVHIGPNAVIGENTIINTHCVIEHDCKIGKHSHISVNATVAGKSKVGDFVMIGTGATVIDGVSICGNVIVGAGAVVVRDITEPGTYVGVPAKKIKSAVLMEKVI